MRVIHVMENLNEAGGVNSFVYDLCIALKSQGHEVSLIALIGNENRVKNQAVSVRNNDIPVYCLCLKSKREAILKGVPLLKSLIMNISKDEMTICNLHLKLGVLLGCLACRRLKNIVLVETYHSQYSHYKFQYDMCKNNIKKYIPCSETAKEEMIHRFHVPDNKICMIPNGVNSEWLRANARLQQKKNNKLSVVSVGRFTNQKNFSISARAFSQVDCDKYEYSIYGDGELRDELIEISKGNPSIQLRGVVSRLDIINAIYSSDIVVMPSLWEGLSILMLETMALGCPMMVSNVASIRDVLHEVELDDNESWRLCKWGYLVDTNNADAYKEALIHYINNPQIKEEMSKNIALLSKEYDINASAERYSRLYETIIN